VRIGTVLRKKRRGRTCSRHRSPRLVSVLGPHAVPTAAGGGSGGRGPGDRLLCQITSNPYSDPRVIVLTNADFRTGSLHLTSYARPGKLFTANQTLIVAEVGHLTDEAFARLVNAVIDSLRASLPP